MKRILIILLLVGLFLCLIAADKPPKPPKLVDLDIVNRSGEEVRIMLTGLGYDFQTQKFVGSWGVIRPKFYYVTVIGSIEVQLPSGGVLTIPMPEHIRELDVLKDLYVIDLTYQQEYDGKTFCLNNWTPVSMYGDPTYYAANSTSNKLIIKACNSIPANIGAPSEGVVKYNRLSILLATSGYHGYGWK